ncbi:beta-N-acetylhexosaminidase [Litoreibacter ponti]|uniref:beta-N-acetylhexosaminidase n=1 Tax=Litoreibacter ponti TaxID=1510457 RepID=A0A2T6BH50_9RHOB|nr:glycoside hydrolase family 3 N-terminal domain-containing protein [Litoreibacter ponti]PTX55384.1 beta-N-acetylhexosaminidase [Litoreibacter ponti]
MASGAYIFGCEGLSLSAPERSFFASAQPWGFILFARNIVDRAQLSALTAELRAAVGWNAPILIDQEGGRVQRMRAPEWREYLPALDQVEATGAHAARAMYLRNRLIAAELFEVGIDANCAPLADVIWPESHPVLRNRCYGSDVETVVKMCLACEQGFLEGGVLPVLKHIPGYGRAVVDGHKDLPTVDVPRAELEALDFAPFKRLTHMAMGMTAHIVFPCIDDLPATTSPKAMKMIREEIGFHNLIMTDDISMEALSGTIAERARAPLDAGCDVVLHCNGDLEEMRTVADVSGPMSEVAQIRAGRALDQRKTPMDIDILAAEDELRTLIAGA